MRSMFAKRAYVTTLAGLTFLSGVCVSAQTQGISSNPQAHLQGAFARLPLGFEPNRGQTDAAVQFLAHTPTSTVFLTGADAVLKTASMHKDEHGLAVTDTTSAVRMHLAGAAAAPVATTEQPLGGKVNYLRGNSSAQWQMNLPTFGGVRLSAVYPGVDLKYYGNSSTLEYDFIVAPQADTSAIKLQFQGTEAKLEQNGDIVLPTSSGKDLRFGRPVAYQVIDGKRVNVNVAFSMSADKDVTFQLGGYDHTHELVIDPTLLYLGTLGTGIQQISLSQIAVDTTGELYMVGTTNDSTFPATANAYQKVCGPAAPNYGTYCAGSNQTSAFVAKLSADGTSLVYATYLSGTESQENGDAIAVDSAGIAYIAGRTGSDTFPVTSDAFQKTCTASKPGFPGGVQSTCDGYYAIGGGASYQSLNTPMFFAKLSADGSKLLYSTFLGGTQPVYPDYIGLDTSGNIYLSGRVHVFSTADLTPGQLPTSNAQFPGITSSGYMTVSSAINSYGNPTGINNAAFLSKFSNDGHTLLYGTFLGDNTAAADVVPTTAAVGTSGIIFLGGYTQAANYPVTPGVLKTACTQPSSTYGYCNTYDGFVSAIDTTKNGAASLLYSTRLGGTATVQGSNTPDQEVLGLLADSSNNVFVTGYTLESTFPMGKSGYQASCPNNTGNVAPSDPTYDDRCDSAFLLKLDPTLSKVLAGTYFAGPAFRSPESVGNVVRVDSGGNILLYGKGNNYGNSFPVLNPVQQDNQPSNVLFVAAFTPDLTHLLFSTLFGNSAHPDYNENTVGVGLVLDAKDNIYIAGDTTDTDFATTAGTYVTAQTTGAGHHPFFAKLSKVLQPTSATLTVTPNPAVQGGNVTYTAVVAGLYQTTPAATGTVTFQFTNPTSVTTIGTGTLDSTGTATFTGAAPLPGTYSVTAAYSGDKIYDVSTASPVTLTSSSKATTVTTVASSAPTATAGTAVTFTATVTSAVSGTPTGTVTFYDGTSNSTPIGTGTLSGAKTTFITSSLAAGTHTILAVYGGDNNYVTSSGNVTQSITAVVPPATIALSANPTTLTITRGSSGSVVITATPTGSYSGTVTFACGTLPQYATCGFAPTTLTFSSSTAAQTTTLTLRTNNTTAFIRPLQQGNRIAQVLAATLFLPVSLLGFALRRRGDKRLQRVGLLMLFVAISFATFDITGCGGGTPATATTTNTPAGSYNIPITASANGATSSLNVSVTVQ